ncbi:hypothetical protein B0H16DRAFT_1558634 [Mycena metata]|uniref:MYND-type domain-containing protein n=1 Tax=Mycena metata TaxID=1033252 RepID=A0AAD7IMT6_9AGAR|nr:hypothetical protein B0H16DRAFT_1558634 [Mycena metata]
MDLFDTCFDTIVRYVMIPFGHNLVTEALRAGILRAFFARARRQCTLQVQHLLDSTIVIFTASVIYLSVLSQMHDSIKDLKFPVNQDSFKGFGLSTKWEVFWAMLQQRFDAMKAYLTRKSVSKACDNVACGVILPRTRFQHCKGCLTSIYCSASCQATDWRQGGHRDACESLLQLRLGEPEGVSSRDKSFLRVLVHADYLEMKQTIIIQEVYHRRTFSSPDVLPYVLFDYSRPYVPCFVTVGAVSGLASTWKHHVSRARESGRRMRLHVMQVADGGCTQEWVFPLRTAGPEVALAVEHLAINRAVDLMSREMAARIEGILSLAAVEIH